MTETSSNHPENNLSPEQRRLIKTARDLLSLPNAITERTYQQIRPTTRQEKAQRIVTKVLDGTPLSALDRRYFFEVIVTETNKTTIGVRNLRNDDTTEGVWAGGVYLEQQVATNFDTKTTTETLRVYATGVVGANGPTELSSYRDKRFWQVDLLKPLEDIEQLTRLQADFDNALVEYRRDV